MTMPIDMTMLVVMPMLGSGDAGWKLRVRDPESTTFWLAVRLATPASTLLSPSFRAPVEGF